MKLVKHKKPFQADSYHEYDRLSFSKPFCWTNIWTGFTLIFLVQPYYKGSSYNSSREYTWSYFMFRIQGLWYQILTKSTPCPCWVLCDIFVVSFFYIFVIFLWYLCDIFGYLGKMLGALWYERNALLLHNLFRPPLIFKGTIRLAKQPWNFHNV